MKNIYLLRVGDGNSHHFSKLIIACIKIAPRPESILLMLLDRTSSKTPKCSALILFVLLLGRAICWAI